MSPPLYWLWSDVFVIETSAVGLTVFGASLWLLDGFVSVVVVVTSAPLLIDVVRAGSSFAVTCTVRVAPGASVP